MSEQPAAAVPRFLQKEAAPSGRKIRNISLLRQVQAIIC